MAKVFVIGPETLLVPTASALAATLDANAGRFWAIYEFLQFELAVLAAAGELQALGCASDSNLTSFFNVANPQSVAPPGITPVTTFTTAQAISGFGATLIINMAGGISPSATVTSDIATLKAQAASSGVLWRDGSGAVPTPQLALPTRQGIKVTSGGASSPTIPVQGWIGGYKSVPTIKYSWNGSNFSVVPNGAIVQIEKFNFNFSAKIAPGTYTLAVQDSLYPSIAASCTVTVS